MFSRLRRLVVLSATVVVVLAFPAGASAAVYCVDMGAACPAGGTASASLTTAIASTNAAADEDWIYLGATTQTATDLNASSPVHVVGSGVGVTRIATSPGLAGGLSLTSPQSTISDVALGNSSSTSGQSVLSISSGDSTHANAWNLAIDGVGRGGLTLGAGAVAARIDIALNMDPAAGAVGVSASASNTTLAAPSKLIDSTVRAAIPVRSAKDGRFDILRSTLDYSLNGIRATTSYEDQVIRLLDSIVRLAPFGVGATETAAFSGSATTVGSNDEETSIQIDVVGSTIDGLGATDGVGIDSVAHLSANVNAPGVPIQKDIVRISMTSAVVLGSFDRSFRLDQGANSGNATNMVRANVVHSIIDLSPSKVESLGLGVASVVPASNTGTVRWMTDVGMVDAAGDDFRLKFGSPLIDAGPTNLEGDSALDRAQQPRPRSAVSSAATYDIGAYEYQWSAPSVTATGPTGAIAPGASVAVTAAGTDADPGESAQLTYTWALPGGGAATGAAATFAAPTAPGLHVATVTVTDPAGIKTSVPVAFSVSVAPYVAPADKLAPMVQFGRLKASLATLVKRKAASFRLELSEAATVRATAVVTVRQPAKKRGGKPKLVKVTVGASAPTALGAGVGAVKITASKTGAALFAKALKVRGAKVASTMLVGTVTDPSGNKRAFNTPVAITK